MTRRELLSILAGLVAAPAAMLLPWRKPPTNSLTYLEPANQWWLVDSEEKAKAWLRQIEREIGVSPVIGDTALCQETSTYYEEVVLDPNGKILGHARRPRFDGYAHREAARFESPEEAWLRWAAAFDNYRHGRKGKLHWRVKPELHHDYYYDGLTRKFLPVVENGYLVYARLVIG